MRSVVQVGPAGVYTEIMKAIRVSTLDTIALTLWALRAWAWAICAFALLIILAA